MAIMELAYVRTVLGLMAVGVATVSASSAQVTTVLVSKAMDGTPANSPSVAPRITPDGRYVAYSSPATNLVSGDVNNSTDAFVWDRQSNRLELVSVTSTGMQATQGVGAAAITADGRYVLLSTSAKLSLEDTNTRSDAYVRDRLLGTTTLASKKPDGTVVKNSDCYPSALSDDGRFVVFMSTGSEFGGRDTQHDMDAYWRDTQTGLVKRVTVSSHGVQGNDDSADAVLSGDGRFVTFTGTATNLVRGDTNGVADIFGHDVLAGRTTRLSALPGGGQANGPSVEVSMTPGGRYVAFTTKATSFDPVHDLNGAWDVYWRDNLTGQVMLCSRTPAGFAGSGGSFSGGASSTSSISANGRYVAFESYASDLIAVDANGPFIPDIYRFDVITGQVVLVSQNSAGVQADDSSVDAVISGDGRFIAYRSYATNLAPTNPAVSYNVFLTELPIGP
ncbi:MAG: PD40 domain-containing protein [Planctomycetes bacterium]|nr:PD40 domain-containing protein [Planctomycetota bacterium]